MRSFPRRVTLATLLFLVPLGAGPLFAQTEAVGPVGSAETAASESMDRSGRPDMPKVSDLFRPLASDVRRMGREQNLFLVGIGTAGALTSHAWDTRVAASGWGHGTTRDILAPGQIVGNFLVQTGGAVGTYAIGRLTHSPRVALIGAELFRAGVVAQGTAQLVKFSTGRTRPDGTSRSFPSGHTASAFATASVLQAELGWKAGVPAYAAAAWVAASRVQMERHYLSDVIAGATIGILAGRSVTVGRGAARFTVSPMVVPGGVGANLVHVSSR